MLELVVKYGRIFTFPKVIISVAFWQILNPAEYNYHFFCKSFDSL
jgi:hypothetical protein